MWFLSSEIDERLQNATAATVEQEETHAAHFGEVDGGAPRIMSVAGNVASIDVRGVITDRPSFMAMLMGGGNTTYKDIRTSLAMANNDPSIKSIDLAIDSPGGQASAEWLDTMKAVAASGKTVTARVGNMAASAAFGIASQSGEIVAQNELSQFGSIGIVGMSKADKSVTSITSSNAPKKRPDVNTEEGREVVREKLDAMEKIFIDTVAEGRGVTSQNVIADFGQGGMLLAEAAIKAGMIDGIAAVVPNNKAASGDTKMEIQAMDLATLKQEHPNVFAAAKQEGILSERDRVGAHLIMGKTSGDMETAVKAVTEGSEMTATIQATYMAAGMNSADVQARKDDDKNLDSGNDDNKVDASDVLEKDTMAIVADKMGLE